MRRRAFITLLGGVVLEPSRLLAQETNRLPRVGFLAMGTNHPSFGVFAEALGGFGWIDGRTVALVPRFAQLGKPEQFDPIAKELVENRVSVIVALINPEILAARRATSTIPIVMMLGIDPVGRGVVRTLAQPGGNVTGLAWDADRGFIAKSVELLRELLPNAGKIGLVIDPAFPFFADAVEAARQGALGLGLELHTAEVRTPDEFENTFSNLRTARVDAVLVGGGSMLFGSRRRIAQFALVNRLPVMFVNREGVEAGGLLSYGPNLRDLWRRSAIYVDKLLRGAVAANLPIEQPTKFELVVNLTTAKALGLDVPSKLLALADEVIE
jgi:putative tryptophan/tyrosine transport system substrate-binding protein